MQSGFAGGAFSAMPYSALSASAAPPQPSSWRFGVPAVYAHAGDDHDDDGDEDAAGTSAATSRGFRAGLRGTPALESPLKLHVRAYGLLLVLLSLVFAYLWLAAGTSAGTWFRGAWYAAALTQAVVAGMLLCAAGGETRRRWGPPLGSTLLPFAAPLLHVLLLEIRLAQPDAGDKHAEWTLWAGRTLALLTLASAGSAAGLYWKRGGSK